MNEIVRLGITTAGRVFRSRQRGWKVLPAKAGDFHLPWWPALLRGLRSIFSNRTIKFYTIIAIHISTWIGWYIFISVSDPNGADPVARKLHFRWLFFACPIYGCCILEMLAIFCKHNAYNGKFLFPMWKMEYIFEIR